MLRAGYVFAGARDAVEEGEGDGVFAVVDLDVELDPSP